MNNLHRELAPVSAEAWSQIEEEAARTFRRHLAGRRLVDVNGPAGETLSAVGTGHLRDIDPPGAGVVARQRLAVPLVELRASFALDRGQIDDVARGAQDGDWQPVKDAARQLAFAEDRAIFEGYPAAGITGIRPASSNPALTLPADPRGYPEAIAQALSELRVAGVTGPYSVVLSADAYTAVSETSDHGYPLIEHIKRLISADIVWAPAIDGAIVATTRGGDFDLRLGQDVAIGYAAHSASEVELYLQETLTFLAYTAEAAVCLGPAAS
ncbi:MAG TPA: family 1 encapsulin nanocompartment shell protein [Streptosporangiaceae bacterium]|jgi:uncharacterized linocin/CFP29 family protein